MASTYEDARLDALRQLNLLDTPPSESFDRITRMASQIFDLPISAVSLTDSDRQWFKSRVGVEHDSIPREKAPCAQVAESANTVLIPDMLADAFYATSVLAGQGIRFYAGAPLTTRDGYGLGALCVLGTEPRTATGPEMDALHDLAQMVMAQIELQHAFGRIDPLSGLPNRLQFLDDLDDLGRDEPDRRRLAVLIELARPEQLNNSIRVMGSGYVDDMVQEAARSLRAVLGSHGTAYHVGATQLAFLAPPDVQEDSYLEVLASTLRKLRAASNVRFAVTSTIGVAPFTTGEAVATDVLRQAHSAALDARCDPKGVSIYSSSNDCIHHRRFALLNAFGEALEASGQLKLAFQPRIDLRTRRCVGAEALLRWRHPELGDVSPAEFMPIIEQTALAGPTTAKVLDAGLKQLRAWHDAGIDIPLSINVSAVNLGEADFAQRLQLYLLKHRVQPTLLEIEVTESAIMSDAEGAIAQLAAIEEAGVRIAIDDFGTGHSSLAYLQQLPAKVVKIDKSFIRDLLLGEREQTLVRSMISLSHELGYHVVAEGIETSETAELLTEMGCDEGQGYFFAAPLQAADFGRWFAAQDQVSAAA